MIESHSDKKSENVEVTGVQPAPEPTSGHTDYTYQSAGITERQGSVPIWLWMVAVSLLVWGIYYLVTFWDVNGRI